MRFPIEHGDLENRYVTKYQRVPREKGMERWNDGGICQYSSIISGFGSKCIEYTLEITDILGENYTCVHEIVELDKGSNFFKMHLKPPTYPNQSTNGASEVETKILTMTSRPGEQ